MKLLDEIEELRELMEIIENIKLKYHVFVETDLNKFGSLINQGIIEETKSWCKNNCWGRWDENGLIFTFELESDAVAFKLRWA